MFRRIWSRYFGNENDTLEERLRKNHSISEKITVNLLLTGAVAYVLDLNRYFSGRLTVWENIQQIELLIRQDYLPLSLAIFTCVWFAIYRQAVRNELEILLRLFSQINPPKDWPVLIGANQIPLLSIFIPLTFLSLAASVKNIQLYCLILLILNIFDVRGNSILRNVLSRVFMDRSSLPPSDDPMRDFISRRRSVAEEYWVARPQIERIGLMMIFNTVALVISLGLIDQWTGIRVWVGIPYIIVMAVIAVNEVTMVRWREIRDHKLEMIKADLEEFIDRRRGGSI